MTYTQTQHGTITWTRKWVGNQLDEGPWVMRLDAEDVWATMEFDNHAHKNYPMTIARRIRLEKKYLTALVQILTDVRLGKRTAPADY